MSGPIPASSDLDDGDSPNLDGVFDAARSRGFTPFGAMLEPVILDATGGALSDIAWFRTDWQRGGALTGYASFQDEHGPHDVVVKLPVPPGEWRWLEAMSGSSVTPRVLAGGDQLGGYDLTWVVMERLPFGPMGSAWGGDGFDLLLACGAEFQAQALATRDQVWSETIQPKPEPDLWEEQLAATRKLVSKHTLPHAQLWRKALKAATKKFESWRQPWMDRPMTGPVHGDFHAGNALSRSPAPNGPLVLVDLAQVRPGHWVEDAVYLEQLYWADPERLEGRRLVSQMNKQRKALGLDPGGDWVELANIRRALLAMTTPTRMATLGHPVHLDAALHVLEQAVTS